MPASKKDLPIDSVILGDCLEVLQALPDECADLVLTDPPYLVNYTDTSGRSIEGDTDGSWAKKAFEHIYRTLKPDSFCISFYGYYAVDTFFEAWKGAGFEPVGHFVFPKEYASSVHYTERRHEQAYLLAKGKPQLPKSVPPDVLPWKYTGNRYHPTQKPLSALLPLIMAYSKVGDMVLDPFAGSGSTGVAARSLDRRYLLVEQMAEYHAVAQKRLQKTNLERPMTKQNKPDYLDEYEEEVHALFDDVDDEELREALITHGRTKLSETWKRALDVGAKRALNEGKPKSRYPRKVA